jgi:hypothetical protein
VRTVGFTILVPFLCSLAHADEANPRRIYNEARRAFEKKDFNAAKKGFLTARDSAQGDVELRARAAFNLGLTLAKEAEGQNGPEALEALRQSAAWFRDLIHLGSDAKETADARICLEVILRRIQALADELNKGQNSLDARLSRVIDDERALRERIADLWNRVDAQGVVTAPTAFREEFQAAESLQRTLLADASTVADLAADETEKIRGKTEKERSQEESMRLVMLGNMEKYGEAARSEMADARHLLGRLQVERAHGKVLAALAALTRAREQMQDPVSVLRGLAEDERTIQLQTTALDGLKKKAFTLDTGKAAKAPVWLTAKHVEEQQTDLDSRLLEVLDRLRAGGQQSSAPNSSEKASDRRMQEILEAAKEAIAPLTNSEQAMIRAKGALSGEDLSGAERAEGDAIAGLLAALERFSDVRGLIELAYADQSVILELLSPDKKDRALSTEGRASLVLEATGHNRDRLARLESKFRDELTALSETTASAPDGGVPNRDVEGQKQLYEQAEMERKSAAQALDTFSDKLKKRSTDLTGSAKLCLSHLESLRRLFFSIVEHLQALHESQAKTYDKTAAAQTSKEDSERAAQLGAAAPTEEQHAQLGAQLADALRKQADEAAQGQKTPGADKKLGDAASEVDGATAAMQKAAAGLKEATASGATMSIDLADTLKNQKEAMARLQKAIELLSPPQPSKGQNQQKGQKQKQESKQVSNEQAERQLQEVREREAERQRERDRRRQTPPEQVEKDW